MDLGGSWTSFGKGLGRSWAPSGRSWPPLGRFFGVQSRAFFKHGPKMGSKSLLDRLWVDLRRDLGGFLGGFGKVWGRIWKVWEGLEQGMVVPCSCLGFNVTSNDLDRILIQILVNLMEVT